jgi:hypothetical protein
MLKSLTENKYRTGGKLMKKKTGLGCIEFGILTAFAESSSHGEAMGYELWSLVFMNCICSEDILFFMF